SRRRTFDHLGGSDGIDHRDHRRLYSGARAATYSGHPNMMTQDAIDRTVDNRVSEQAAGSTFREVDDTDRAIPAIEFRNVTMIYDGRTVLNDLSFKVMKGETKIILGGSGCGKSTTIKLVLGLIKPDTGQILVDGEDVTNYNETQMMKVRKKLGMIFQEGALFD